jgi:hypothetical protein
MWLRQLPDIAFCKCCRSGIPSPPYLQVQLGIAIHLETLKLFADSANLARMAVRRDSINNENGPPRISLAILS